MGMVTVMRTASKVSKYGVCCGSCFPVFSPNAGKCGAGKAPYLDTFYVVIPSFTALFPLLNIDFFNHNISKTYLP